MAVPGFPTSYVFFLFYAQNVEIRGSC